MSQPPNKTWVYVLVGVVLGGVILGGGIFAISKAVMEMGPGGESKLSSICAERLSKSAKAQLLYAADHDDRLPPAGAWVDATWTYGETPNAKGEKLDPSQTNESNFRCPSISAMRAGGYGYAFDSRLTSASISEIPNRGEAPLIFDSRLLTRNANGLPKDMLPLPLRHDMGKSNFVAFVDNSLRRIASDKDVK